MLNFLFGLVVLALAAILPNGLILVLAGAGGFVLWGWFVRDRNKMVMGGAVAFAALVLVPMVQAAFSQPTAMAAPQQGPQAVPISVQPYPASTPPAVTPSNATNNQASSAAPATPASPVSTPPPRKASTSGTSIDLTGAGIPASPR